MWVDLPVIILTCFQLIWKISILRLRDLGLKAHFRLFFKRTIIYHRSHQNFNCSLFIDLDYFWTYLNIIIQRLCAVFIILGTAFITLPDVTAMKGWKTWAKYLRFVLLFECHEVLDQGVVWCVLESQRFYILKCCCQTTRQHLFHCSIAEVIIILPEFFHFYNKVGHVTLSYIGSDKVNHWQLACMKVTQNIYQRLKIVFTARGPVDHGISRAKHQVLALDISLALVNMSHVLVN